MAASTLTIGTDWTAVAGPGDVVVTPNLGTGVLYWTSGSELPSADLIGGIIVDQQDREFSIPAGDQLYLRSRQGDYRVTVHRDAEPD